MLSLMLIFRDPEDPVNIRNLHFSFAMAQDKEESRNFLFLDPHLYAVCWAPGHSDRHLSRPLQDLPCSRRIEKLFLGSLQNTRAPKQAPKQRGSHRRKGPQFTETPIWVEEFGHAAGLRLDSRHQHQHGGGKTHLGALKHVARRGISG